MEDYSAVLNLLLLTTCVVHLSWTDTHSLQYLYTVNGQFIAVGLVDGEQFVYYDNNMKMIPKTEWIKKIEADDPRYWDRETQHMTDQQDRFQVIVNQAKKRRLNPTEEVHTLQRMHGCELDDNGTKRGYIQYAYDGEDYISLDLKTGTWTAANDKAERFINNWDPKGAEAEYWKDFLENDCIDRLKKFMTYGNKTLERKVVPEVSLFQKHSPSPEVVCHATGFFPKALNITWQKDGEDVHEDVELSETLPNQDGSFQRRSILKVSRMKLQKHTYTCVVQHSSLEKELVREVPKGRGTAGGTGGPPIAIITAVVALIVLVALVAVVAGIVIWKKRKSGWRTTGTGDSPTPSLQSVTV
ncbi:BOLA class I histocompatibility antigen, alpha chain BL3-7-like [Clarias gariepinus]|uniref:BOLA class I histocompatibility antigen, alpha chain BL3-7-like n=1 Tax=Clarias gariepinus TaxID=13013 RepID=UPI00234D0166|nr:BOLA class I histocompatibility antigen, alpha chain BL3-7-like [Clarias gariepinus]XP_053337132.1 BOLA class I histocompatibility antigen, alpha chain BL3-7-like [Clarias gariepinus]